MKEFNLALIATAQAHINTLEAQLVDLCEDLNEAHAVLDNLEAMVEVEELLGEDLMDDYEDESEEAAEEEDKDCFNCAFFDMTSEEYPCDTCICMGASDNLNWRSAEEVAENLANGVDCDTCKHDATDWVHEEPCHTCLTNKDRNPIMWEQAEATESTKEKECSEGGCGACEQRCDEFHALAFMLELLNGPGL